MNKWKDIGTFLVLPGEIKLGQGDVTVLSCKSFRKKQETFALDLDDDQFLSCPYIQESSSQLVFIQQMY